MRIWLKCFVLTLMPGCLSIQNGWALDPHKALTQYTRNTWSQKDGLPEEMVRAIVQTLDGYLWLGTDEGLARFDGYDFKLYTKDNGNLPSNSIAKLAAGKDGSLWIGTSNGLTHYSGTKFQTYTIADGLSDNTVGDLMVDHAGTVWVTTGGFLSHFTGSRFEPEKITFGPASKDRFLARSVYEDPHHVLWVAGVGVAYGSVGHFTTVVSAGELNGNLITGVATDRHGNLWLSGSLGLLLRPPGRKMRHFGMREGLPNVVVRSILVDRDDVLWVGTDSGLARFEDGRLSSLSSPNAANQTIAQCLLEDREGNLWVGGSNGLTRLRDDIFTSYGRGQGLPGDDPTTVFQDRGAHIWIGFRNSGLVELSLSENRVYTSRTGLPSNEVFSIRQAKNGDLLVGMGGGYVRLHGSQTKTLSPVDELGRTLIFDAMEDSKDRVWLATQSGLCVLLPEGLKIVLPGGPLIANLVISITEARDGTIWAGTSGRGLWWLRGQDKQLLTKADGLNSNQIYALYEDPEKTLWIGTFGGGLNVLRNGKFEHFTAKDGLLSDNISHVLDDGESLWLSTTRGICRISKQQLRDFSEHRISVLKPMNYGMEDGLGSSQLAPGFVTGGGTMTTDGKLWFPTARGVAVMDPKASRRPQPAPAMVLTDVAVDGSQVPFLGGLQLRPGSERIRIRYSAIHLSAPERLRYSHKLVGLNKDWVYAGREREINYNSLPHGKYQFLVRAEIPDGQVGESSYDFEVLPRVWETFWFRALLAIGIVTAAWGIYQLRLRRLRHWFSLVLEERVRLAREIHDTLAQGFIGISAQLDAVAMALPEDIDQATQDLGLAQRMARYGITEARRAVIDLRGSALESQDLAAALQSGAQIWTAGSGVTVEVEIDGPKESIPEEVGRHLLRISQEAITNAVKHAKASRIWVTVKIDVRNVYLRIVDNGRGFEPCNAFSSTDGHFGLIGMRERAERLGGALHLASHPGEGTKVEVTVILP